MEIYKSISAIFLVCSTFCWAKEVPPPSKADNPAITQKQTVKPQGAEPGDLYLTTVDGEYLSINKDAYAVIVKSVDKATTFGRLEYDRKTYYVANSGEQAGYYLSYSSRGYMGTYAWQNSVPWKKSNAACITVDNDKTWKTYLYNTGGVDYAVIGDYSYKEKCFLPVSATAPYVPIKLQAKYIGENAACTWQKEHFGGICPPYVVYFTESQTGALAITISGGKLYQGGELFDTTKADKSHSNQPTSIFVMDLQGNIYASKQFKPALLHHSSILAGRSVAFAGEMQVKNGEITTVTNCSGHYLPPIELATQFTDSLKKQGYTNDVKVTPCNFKALEEFMRRQ